VKMAHSKLGTDAWFEADEDALFDAHSWDS
jgi:hypothetical protein